MFVEDYIAECEANFGRWCDAFARGVNLRRYNVDKDCEREDAFVRAPLRDPRDERYWPSAVVDADVCSDGHVSVYDIEKTAFMFGQELRDDIEADISAEHDLEERLAEYWSMVV